MVLQKGFKVKNNSRVIDKAIKRCGSQAELARKLQDISNVWCYPQKINEWRSRGVIPPYWVRHFADILDIKRATIDPMLYG